MQSYLKCRQILLWALTLLPNAAIATAAASRLTNLHIENIRNKASRSMHRANHKIGTLDSVSISVQRLHERGALPHNDNDKTSGVDSMAS